MSGQAGVAVAVMLNQVDGAAGSDRVRYLRYLGTYRSCRSNDGRFYVITQELNSPTCDVTGGRQLRHPRHYMAFSRIKKGLWRFSRLWGYQSKMAQ